MENLHPLVIGIRSEENYNIILLNFKLPRITKRFLVLFYSCDVYGNSTVAFRSTKLRNDLKD